jgi:hypothetical protein
LIILIDTAPARIVARASGYLTKEDDMADVPANPVETRALVEIAFTKEQRESLEKATGLQGLTGMRLVDLDADQRTKLSPGLVRVTAMVMCW